MVNETLVRHLAIFGYHLIESEDVDPLYPILAYLVNGMPEEQQLWFIALYLTYYNLASAVKAFRLCPLPATLPLEARTFPCATERRNLRGGKVIRHLKSYLESTCLGQKGFLQTGWKANEPRQNYERFWVISQSIWNNGRWAAFKWSEILKKVLGWNLEAPDMRMEFCTGPKAGLELIYQHPNASVKQLNRYGEDLMLRLNDYGTFVVDWEQLETLLCNFHSLSKGRYYVGHDIDELQAVIEHGTLALEDKAWLYDARKNVLPFAYLGELNGWFGIRKERMTVYRDRSVILV